MKPIYHLESWANTHYPKWLNFVRMALGFIIFSKGYIYTRDTESLMEIIRSSEASLATISMVHFIAFAHIFGGIFIALGIGTRVAVLFQLPIILGAVIFVNASKGFFAVNSELGFSLAVLVFLIIFLIYGSGKISLHQYILDLREKQQNFFTNN